MYRHQDTLPDKAQMSRGDQEMMLTYQRVYSHSMWLLELADLLDMVHKVSSVYILHHEIQSVLEHKDVRKERRGMDQR